MIRAMQGEVGAEGASVRWPIHPFPVYVLLIAAYPVLFLLSENLAEVHLGDALVPLARALVLAAAAWLPAAVVLRDLRRGALVGAAVIVWWYGYGRVAELVAPQEVTRDAQLVGWAVGVGLLVLASIVLSRKWIGRVTGALNVVALVLVALTLVQILPSELSRRTVAATPQDAGPIHPGDRDIYFLVYDRYGSEHSIEALAGISNDLPAWLTARGFYVASNAHANYGRTAMSLAATLNLRFLDELAAQMGPDSDDAKPINEMIQEHEVERFLHDRGYRYVNIGNWWGPTKKVRSADVNPTMDGATDFEVVLERTTFEPTLDDLRNVPDPPSHHLLHRASSLFALRALDELRTVPGPKFVMMHVLLPHEPYVFDAFGDYPPAEVQAARTLDDGYREQLKFTNAEIRRIVDELLAGPDETDPIVIIAADEGPYPDRYAANQVGFDWGIATPDELETKFGILNAMYLPGEAPADAPAPYPSMSSVNTFPIVFNRYFGTDLPLHPDRSWSSASWVRPYDLTEITDRLPDFSGAG
jgi:hypothetical protein